MPVESRPRRAAEAVSVLAGPAMRGPLQDLLRSRGLRLQRWEHLRSHHRPGGAVSALYRVQCRRTGPGPATDAALTLHLGATTGDVAADAAPAGPDVAPARIAGLDLRLWFHPHDPVLRSLPWATDAGAVAKDVFGAGGPARLSLVAYRPLRRAVVRARHLDDEAYLKLLPREQLPALRRRHRLLEGSGVPAPRLLPGASAPVSEAVILSALPGTSLFRLLVEDAAAVRPEVLLDLLEALPSGALDLPLRRSWADRAVDYAGAAAAALPRERDSIFDLAGGIRDVVESAPAGPLVPVHGDFHEGNLLLSGGRVTGLLDIDGLGPGRRVDDLACLLGHLAVLAAANPSRPQLGQALADFRRVFEDAADPAALNARAAGVVLTLVSGARAANGRSRTQNAGIRLAAAQRLLRAADR
ncbi:phosphotransferase family protein [Arthrobacter sp. zg-Y1110]|uniref:phosphotransferase family protein n=1 Tax=Arthrobacter sp. zg-Y1110 TaxID=2886932 RepID=UPI001D136A52|nr:phosphotransferase [Arthrobacter sp. zg-Y1110]MCC3290344.1 aminoglycoside phosphotransferase family protein [Arthrobacter sp. zg-Y1110]UWX84280.1 aminoglycoside phosphotransferase family protein [Arthrobacter sp. zg-Y1110]